MKVQINDDVDLDSWKNLQGRSAFNSPFQTIDFYNFFNSVTDYQADVFAVYENYNYTSLAVVTIQKEKGIKSIFSKRGIIYGGPLAQSGCQESLYILLENLRNYYKKKLIYLEFRNYFDFSEFRDVFEKNRFIYNPWLNFRLKTDNHDKMLSAISESRLRQIKQALKNGVTWEEAGSEDNVKDFYCILSDLYKTKIRKPLPTELFFINFYRHAIGKFLLVYYSGKIIGGIMCAILPCQAIYEFYICGLDNEYKKQYPSVIATWSAMEYANQNNISIFDFMGAGSPDEKYGVREFKTRFGGEPVEYGRFIKINKPLLYKLGELVIKISKSFSK